MVYVAKIKYNSIGNWKGISTSLYVSGCCHKCRGCFQPETWNPKYGYEYTEEVKQEIIKSLNNDYITGLVLLGGEPFMSYNCDELVDLCQVVRNVYADTKALVAFTGWRFEDLLADPQQCELLEQLDVLIDGKFKQDLFSPKLNFRGSSNQRIIDVQESLAKGEVVLHELNN